MWILDPEDAAAAEHHLVLRQSSCLIREQVLDLPQVLGDVQGPALNPGVPPLVVQVQIVLDEVDLTQFDNLNGYVQGDWDQHLRDTGWLRFHGTNMGADVSVTGRLTCSTMIIVQKT